MHDQGKHVTVRGQLEIAEVFSFHHVGSRDLAQVARLDGKHSSLLNSRSSLFSV